MKKRKSKKSSNKSYTAQALKILLSAVIFALLTAGLILLTKKVPSFTEGPYRAWSLNAMDFLSNLFSFVKFSVAEIFIYIGVVIFIISLIVVIKNIITRKNKLSRLFRYLSIIVLVLAIGVFLFYSLWGSMYFSDGFKQLDSYDIKDRHVDQLIELCDYLIQKANGYSKQVVRNEQGYYTGYGFDGYAKLTSDAVSLYTNKKEALPKYVISSEAWSYTRTSGMFTCFTGEANINTNDLAISLPFTCAHEMAHRNGITSEDEANFFAFYTLLKSDNVNLHYSAYSMSVIYAMNSLYSKDADTYKTLAAKYSDELKSDFAQYSEHWKRYEGKVSEFSDKVNDTYLKTQGDTDGTQSYGRVTDILLGWYEAEIKGK